MRVPGYQADRVEEAGTERWYGELYADYWEVAGSNNANNPKTVRIFFPDEFEFESNNLNAVLDRTN